MDSNQQKATTAKVIILPGSPAIINGLGYGDVASSAIAQAIKQQLDSLKIHSADIVGSRDPKWYTAHTGSLRAWGPCTHISDTGNYLPELLAGFFLDQAGISIAASREHIGELHPDRLTVVVLDGSAGLDARAPLSLLPTAADIHQWCVHLLTAPTECENEVNAAQLGQGGIQEPQLWLELVQLAPRVINAQLFVKDITLGVGRYGAMWELM